MMETIISKNNRDYRMSVVFNKVYVYVCFYTVFFWEF